jgi:D-proline reductase (dithiol) PrdB
MGRVSDLSLKDQIFVRTYRWRQIDPVPWTPLKKPLSECRLGLVSTAGLSAPDQPPFDKKKKGGDPAFRAIPSAIDVQTLIENHRSKAWDHRGLEQDKNLGFPIDRVHELVESGRIGSVASHFFSFMGSVTAPGRMVRDSVPRVADMFVQDEVDVALLVPV